MRYLTAGESHGPQLTAIIEGIPSGLALTATMINVDLRRRQNVDGRGGRMKIEQDEVQIVSGVRHGITLGSPITLVIPNKDFKNNQELMSVERVDGYEIPTKTVPRAGHADLSGAMKYNHKDLQNVLERASARETAIRVAIGGVCKQILSQLNVEIVSEVTQIGTVTSENGKVTEEMKQAIDQAKAAGDSLGGKVKITATELPIGLGSYVHYDRKLDAKLAHDVMSIQLVKGAKFGENQTFLGRATHDQIAYDKDQGFHRLTNHSGGIEGGMTTGMPMVIHVEVKPIPTLYKPIDSVDLLTKEVQPSLVERSDTCGVPAVAVILESVVATTLTQEILNQFTSDTMEQLKGQVTRYRKDTHAF